MISLQNRYYGIDESKLNELKTLAKNKLEKYFYQDIELKIKSVEIEQDKIEKVINDIQKVLEKHDCENAISAKVKIVPKKNYHQERHGDFDAQTNKELEKVMPFTPTIRKRK